MAGCTDCGSEVCDCLILGSESEDGYTVTVAGSGDAESPYVIGVSGPTGPTDPNAVQKATLDAHTLLGAIVDDTPVAFPVAEQRIVGRVTGGNIADLTPDVTRGVLNTATTTGLVVPKTSGVGIKVDAASPKFGWRDIEAVLVADEAAATAPNLTKYVAGGAGKVTEYLFATNDQLNVRFRVPHDYAPATDLFIAYAWSHNCTTVTGTGTVTGVFTSVYAKGHEQAAFGAEAAVTATNALITTANTPQYHHRVEEVQLSTSGGGAGMLDTDLLEPDGMILTNFEVTARPTISGGGDTGGIFVHSIFVHYQSTSVGTAQKAPNFYA